MAELLEELDGAPGRAVPVLRDLTEPGAIEEVIETCTTRFGAVPNVAVVNAGHGLPGTVLTSDDRRWSELIEINVTSVLRQLRAFVHAMLDGPPERSAEAPNDVVVLGSSVGRNVSPFNSIYGATKFAVHGAVEGLRREVGPLGIRVSLVEPGIVATNFQANAGYDPAWFDSYVQEIGPVLVADDIARVIDFIITQPRHVHLNDVMIRPTRQAYP